MRRLIIVALAAGLLAPLTLVAQPRTPFRPPVTYTDEVTPPLPPEVTDDKRVARNYPEQPPVIPHSIRDYEINLNSNRCLTCHSRRFTEGSQAPMISVTHYIDRQGQVLGAVAPRRYFCTQCHVPQTAARPPIDNTFVDVDTLLSRPQGKGTVP